MNTINIEDIKEQCRQLSIKTGGGQHIVVKLETKYYEHRKEEIVTDWQVYIESTGHGENCPTMAEAVASALGKFEDAKPDYLAKAEFLEAQASTLRKLAGETNRTPPLPFS